MQPKQKTLRHGGFMENQKKVLTRIQLVNWHYFQNERISVHGSTLISGENTAGKSTVLDAMQLVLTTNTRRFNMAANEKGNRNLRGYVRCKVGNIGETYLRKNVVPANVALEFYEEKNDRYFVMGVHMTSFDEESPVITKWYLEECRLENLSFLVEKRPALAEEFKVDGRPIRFMEQNYAARDRFKRKLGNLDDKFFDMIPKSLAFKPMDNVKEFINKFVLSESKIDVAALRESIETLTELEHLLERSGNQYKALETILATYEKVEEQEFALRVNEILLAFLGREQLEQELEELEKELRVKTQALQSNQEQAESVQKRMQTLDEQMIALNVAIQSNSSGKLVEDVRRRITQFEAELVAQETQEEKLNEQIALLKRYCMDMQEISYKLLSNAELAELASAVELAQKNKLVEKIELFQKRQLEEIRTTYARQQVELEELNRTITKLQERLQELEKQNLTYPADTMALKKAIEQEFLARGIQTNVHVLAELLEITEETWVNAVEGYFNTQKFYLLVEPKYYDIAVEVYERQHGKLHTAGIINTKKLPLTYTADASSLAYVVKSENRYAKAYVDYVMGQVIRCNTVKELEQHNVAVTAECMLYHGFVVRHINPKLYKDPYIGRHAYRTQIINVRKQLEEMQEARISLRDKQKLFQNVLDCEKQFDFTILKLYLNAPAKKAECNVQLVKERAELEKASNDPSLMQLQFELQEKEKEKAEVLQTEKQFQKEIARLGNKIEVIKQSFYEKENRYTQSKNVLDQKQDADGTVYTEAVTQYEQNRKIKGVKKTAEQFTSLQEQLLKEKERLLDKLKELQYRYNTDFTEDFRIGPEGMTEYRTAMHKLKAVELLRNEEKLRLVKEDCEQIFRSDFLSKMKELIENARTEFRNLNKALDHIYYGDDSYHFKLTFDKKKESLYRMITSENNQQGINLWTAEFEEQYKEEMAELFSKLMTKDDNGQKVIEEYTDYRSYLDYDIEIRKKDGSVQHFSDIYAEKSGSETQVPYYVAIAASFYQLYRYGNSVRIMLLDEAFDKMDDERISSMMDFFKGLDLQVIMATPPAKIEVIGEKVDTVLTAIRVGQNSIIEEYLF